MKIVTLENGVHTKTLIKKTKSVCVLYIYGGCVTYLYIFCDIIGEQKHTINT